MMLSFTCLTTGAAFLSARFRAHCACSNKLALAAAMRLAPLEICPGGSYKWVCGSHSSFLNHIHREVIMNLIRRNPSSVAGYRPHGIEDQFGRLVDNMFENMLVPFSQGNALAQWQGDIASSPRLDISETDQVFEVQVDMPGVKKEDVKVSVDHQRVTIEGESKRESERREGENMLYTERSASRYVRSFMLPAEVDESSAQARMENGVLTMTLPKKQGNGATRIAIQ
jgi:HSP20 family protein